MESKSMNRHVHKRHIWARARASIPTLCVLLFAGLAFAQAPKLTDERKATPDSRFGVPRAVQAAAKVGDQWEVVRLVHFGFGAPGRFMSCLVAGADDQQRIVQVINWNHVTEFPYAFAIAVDEGGQSGVLCEYYDHRDSTCRIRLTQFMIQEALYTGADPEGFVGRLYQADPKQEATAHGLRREDLDQRMLANKVIETEFTMRRVDGAKLPVTLRRDYEMSLSLSAKSIAIALRIGVIQGRGDDVLTAVLDRSTKKWIPTAALSVKPDKASQ